MICDRCNHPTKEGECNMCEVIDDFDLSPDGWDDVPPWPLWKSILFGPFVVIAALIVFGLKR
jgi:hypothetical protein